MRTPFCSITLFLLLLGLSATHAYGQAKTHDGFYLRLATGIGAAHAEGQSDLPDFPYTIEGSGGAANISIGYMVVENLGLFFEVSSTTMIGPEFSSQSGSVQAGDDVKASIAGSGFGVIYYFMPVNVYLSTSFNADTLLLEIPTPLETQRYESDPGGGINFMVGKEWWVSDNWGLGVAASFRSSRMKSDGGDVEWTAKSMDLLFSATYN